MNIDLNTKVAALLEAYPDLEKKLLELSPAFAKLQNPVLRRTVARIATLGQAAKIADISPALLVQTLRQAAGLAEVADSVSIEGNENESTTPPSWFDETKIKIRFDAVPVIDSGASPMQEIIRHAESLGEGEIMELSAPFKPIPIIDLLVKKGFETWTNEGKSYFCKI